MKAPVLTSFVFALFLSIALFPLRASFAENSGQAVCSDRLGSLAENIMSARQSGVSLSKVMEMIEEHNLSDPVRRMSQTMATDAYSRTRFQTYEFQQKAIEEFRNDYEVICYREYLDLN